MTFTKGDDRMTGVDAAHWGLDEIVASEVDFHMERMDKDYLWFVLYDKKGGAQHVDIYARGNGLFVNVRPYEEPERGAKGEPESPQNTDLPHHDRSE